MLVKNNILSLKNLFLIYYAVQYILSPLLYYINPHTFLKLSPESFQYTSYSYFLVIFGGFAVVALAAAMPLASMLHLHTKHLKSPKKCYIVHCNIEFQTTGAIMDQNNNEAATKAHADKNDAVEQTAKKVEAPEAKKADAPKAKNVDARPVKTERKPADRPFGQPLIDLAVKTGVKPHRLAELGRKGCATGQD